MEKVLLKSSQIIDLIIVAMIFVAIVIGGYNYYVESAPKLAEFEVADLIIIPEEVGIDESVTISAMVTNIGGEIGSYSVELKIDGVVEGTNTVELESGMSEIVEFTVTKGEQGSYSVEIEDLSGLFEVMSEPSQDPEAKFRVHNLVISPVGVEANEPVTISATVTNIGGKIGSYSVELKIDGVVEGTNTVELESGMSEIVEFTVTKGEQGSYSVEIEDLSETFVVLGPMPSELTVTKVDVSPYEAWVDDPIKISVEVSNIGTEAISYLLAFRVNDVIREVKPIQLSAGENTIVEATLSESKEGKYNVNIGGKTTSFTIVPTGKHTLIIARSGQGGALEFNLDGANVSTTFRELVDVGIHTITVPLTVETDTAVFQFKTWNDETTDLTRTVDVQSRVILTISYDLISGVGSCPALYVWNGTDYLYRTEVSDGPGWLGFVDYFREDGSLVFAAGDPWDYIKLDRSQLQPRNGSYEMIMVQNWNEISYIDSLTLMVVDHSSDVDVFSNKGTYINNLEELGKIYTVSKNPLTPISAINIEGEDVLPLISKFDGVYTAGTLFEWNMLEVNLGDLSNAKEINLMVGGSYAWPTNEEGGQWVGSFYNKPGEKPFPNPSVEVKNEEGKWVPVPDSRQFFYLDVTADMLVYNMTGLFPTNNYTIRIHTIFDICFDYIGVDTTPQQNLVIQEIFPVADLTQKFKLDSISSGNFTRYGDVTPLLRHTDDKFVIIRRGDQVLLKFPITDLEPVPENMKRDYFLFANVQFKGYGLPYLDFTVNPLPFTEMSAFPYPPTESYPYDEDHLNYLSEYNTREIAAP